ncbi:MAG: DinB family protein, partial [Kiloniellales bacterium]
MLQDHFRMMGRFNAWANRRVYDAVAALGDDDYRKTRPAAFFGSIHGTLNHLLVVDHLWFGRIEGTDSGVTSLDQILQDDLAGLRAAR